MGKYLTGLFSILIIAGVLTSSGLSAKENAGSQDLALNKSGPQLFMMAATLTADGANQQKGSILENARIKIINLGPVINHEGVDYAPTVSADGRTLYYVSERPGSRLEDGTDETSHDFWVAKKNNRLDTIFFEPYNLDTLTGLDYLNVNTEFNEGAASISPDRQTIYFTACQRPDGLGFCDIYKSEIQGEVWGRPVNLGRNVNSEAWESQPSISPDQRRLYFISTREGPNSNGKPLPENMDIWYSDWDDDMEEWGPAQNLEEINTEDMEYTPFIAADNVTLFFASNGHKPNVGGLDFFVTRLDPGTNTWSTPENLGEPINTKGDESFITLPASGDVIYFSSTRQDISGAQGNLDVYMAFVPSFFKAVNLITTVVDECSGEFIPAKLTIKNPITGRVVEDSVTFNRQSHELIISNTDYGNPKDSIKFVDLEITAENDIYGSTTVVKRVEKPGKTEDPNEAEKPTEIRLKLTLGQRPVLNTEIDESEYISKVKISQPDLASFRGLVMYEVEKWDLYPLLNYIFFSEGESTIPDRYILFDDPMFTESFSDTTIPGGTLDKYYQALNIFGFRLQQNPSAKVTLVGTNDDQSKTEKGDMELSKARAQAVYDYLTNIWKIDPARLTMEHRGLPKHPTSTRIDSIGIEENRRVEFLCDDWEVMKPVFDRDKVREPQPQTMQFVMKNGIQNELVADRRIEIRVGEKIWKTLTEVGITEEKAEWDWRSEEGKYPANEVPYTAQLVITTQSGAECVSDPVVIPVKQVSTDEQLIANIGSKTLEKYNLILFPFDSYDPGERNNRIMNEYVYNRVFPPTEVEVVGHTDVVGMYDHNRRLSDNRAKSVKDGINKKTKGNYAKLESRGVGEDDPLYGNETPEERFYNRTVQVIIQTPLQYFEENPNN